MNSTLLPTASALKAEWVERIFTVMACTYGKRFAELWAATDAEDMKRFWAKKLFPFSANPHAIGLALDRMAEEFPNPPSLPQFYDLCRQAARNGVKPESINPHSQPASPDVAHRALGTVAHLVRGPKVSDARQWAMALRERYLAGEPLYLVQIEDASEALGEVWEGRQCHPRRSPQEAA
jgi:hypothetical protein